MTDDKMPRPTVVWQSRPSEHRNAVYLCGDAKYVPYSLFVADQIALAHPSRNFDICIVSADAFAPHPLYGLHNLRAVQIETGSIADKVNFDPRVSYATYLRIFMPRIWETEYDRLFYLDSDVFFQRGDISKLLSAPMCGAAIAAVPDVRFWGKPQLQAKDISALGLPHAPYFNAGVLLIDVNAFVNQGYSDRVLNLLYTRGKQLGGHDQTALNIVMSHKWAELPVQWNYPYFFKTMMWAAHFNVCVYHFVGTRKPYRSKYGLFSRRLTTPYRLFFEQHFPSLAPQVLDGLGGTSRFWLMVLASLVGLSKLKGILQLEARVDGDFDIKPL